MPSHIKYCCLCPGLGPGQLVGRQVLGSPVLGDIQLSLCDKRGDLEIEVGFGVTTEESHPYVNC